MYIVYNKISYRQKERVMFMSEQRHRNSANGKGNSATNFPQSMIILIMAMACISMVAFTLIAVAKDQNNTLHDHEIAATTEPVTYDTQVTTPPEITQPSEDIEAQAVAELIEKADFIAAGYDYQKAIEMLQSSEYYGSNEYLSSC